jgi:hypothetical protein
VLEQFREQRVSIFLLLDGSPRGGELPWGYFVLFPSRVSGESHSVLQSSAFLVEEATLS